MGMAAILFNDKEPSELSVNIPFDRSLRAKSDENWSSGFREVVRLHSFIPVYSTGMCR